METYSRVNNHVENLVSFVKSTEWVRMISYDVSSGHISVYEDGDFVKITLNNFVGHIEDIDGYKNVIVDITGRNLDTLGMCLRIHTTSQDKTDSIIIKGKDKFVDSIDTAILGSTSIEISNVNITNSLECAVYVLKVQDCRICTAGGVMGSGWSIWARSYIRVVDSTILGESELSGFWAPYIFIENSNCSLIHSRTYLKPIPEGSELVITEGTLIENSATKFICECLVKDDEGYPKSFVYTVVRDEDGQVVQVIDRQKHYSYIPAQLATAYDEFKHSTGYTNVDLHRWIDNEGEIYIGRGVNSISDEVIDAICNGTWDDEVEPEELEVYEITDSAGYIIITDLEDIIVTGPYTVNYISPEVVDQICNGTYIYDNHPHSSEPMSAETVQAIIDGTYEWPRMNDYELDEVKSRSYEVGIYSLNSYRTTTMSFYDENSSEIDELELP